MFETYIHMCETPGFNRRWNHVKTPWFNIFHVCTYWYDLLAHTPAHWKTIYVGHSVEWLDLCLSRSASASLDIYFVKSYKVPTVLLERLVPHAQRIQIIMFDLIPSEILPHIADLLCRDMPTLTTLHLDRRRMRNGPTPPLNAILPLLDVHINFGNIFPKLTTIILVHFSIPRDTLALCRLRELELNACFLDMSFNNFIHTIGQCEALERLSLTSIFDRLYDTPKSSTHLRSNAPATLHRLRSVYLKDNTASTTSTFLSAFIFPAADQVKIKGERDGTEPSNGLAPVLPCHPSITFPVFSALTFASFYTRDWEKFFLSGGFTFDSSFPLFTPAKVLLNWGDQYTRGRLRDLTHLLHNAPLKGFELEIASPDHFTDVRDPTAWLDVFTAFPQLETFHVVYFSESLGNPEPLNALWSGLGRASSVGQDEQDIGFEAGHRRPLHPCLRHIEFELIQWPFDLTEDIFDFTTQGMLQYLRERAAMGARLEFFKCEWTCPSSSYERFPIEEMKRAFLELLRSEELATEILIE